MSVISIKLKKCYKSVALISQTGRHLSSSSSNLLYRRLNNRGVVSVRGADSQALLQGLITNDIHYLEDLKLGAISTFFLNNQGRVLYDAVIFSNRINEYYVEVDATLKSQLLRHLKIYKLRKKVEICAEDDLGVTALLPESLISKRDFSDEPLESFDESGLEFIQSLKGLVSFVRDPRLLNWTYRCLMTTGSSWSTLTEDVDDVYGRSRYCLGIGEGPLDHPMGKALPLESNAAGLNGVSFNKGCYIGQELTARSFHTGVIRKRLVPVQLSSSVKYDLTSLSGSDIIDQNGKKMGIFRNGVQKSYGLALLRLSCLDDSNTLQIVSSGHSDTTIICRPYKPFWWKEVVGNT